MITITEDRIGMLAPNAAAAANGKKISRSGGFVSLNQDREKTVIWGECKGSGKSNYKTSVDFFESGSAGIPLQLSEPPVPVQACAGTDV